MAKNKSSWSEGEVSGADGKQVQSGGKFKRHCVRFWWLYILAIIVIVVVVVVAIIFGVIPKTVQKTIDGATVTVDQQALTNPGPNSFDLTINTTLNSETDREANVQGFNASFYLLDTKPDIKPFIYVPFPAAESQPQIQPVNIGQSGVQIADMDQFIAYNKLVLSSETFQVGVRGKTHVVLKGLPRYGVTYDKVVTMKGYNKFAGMQISQVQFHLPPEFDGATMTGKVMIPNPSVISAQFGNITLDLSANGTSLGYSVVQYVDFKPGNNTYDMRSYIDTGLALQYVHDNVLDLEIRGNSSVNIVGQHLTYFEEALKSNVIQYRLNLTEATSGASS